MNRYGIYITVILLVLTGAFFKGFSQNSNIVSIQMTYPIDDTIFDPANDSIIVQIVLNDWLIWQNNPPANIGFFSQSNNYSWTNKAVTNTTLFNPLYKCVSPVFVFNEDVNTVYFWLHDPANDIDTVKSFTITYNKPHIELTSVTSSDLVIGSRHYVVYESNPELVINAHQSFPSLNPTSFINKVDLKKSGTPYFNDLWQNPTGVADITITQDLPAEFSLDPGSSQSFILQAAGRTRVGYTGPPDVSEELSFELTYLYLAVPDTVCQVNSNISLTGYPPGGSFEGNGIVDNTNNFNPSMAVANAYNTITYKYIIDGQEFSVSRDIYVINQPVIQLDGNFEVCANSTDVLYKILNPDNAKYIYNWEFIGAEVIDSTEISRTVHWQADPASFTGHIFIRLESKNPNQFCPAVFEYLVDIDPDAAPDKPCIFFGDTGKRLLLSSNTKASYYKWYINDSDSLGISYTPYLFLTDNMISHHNIDNSTVFTIRIANQETGCYTTGYMCTGAQAERLPDYSNINADELSLAILTNPVGQHADLQITGSYSGRIDLQVYSTSGSLIYSGQWNKLLPLECHEIDFQHKLSPGIYVISCRYMNRSTAPLKMIVY